MVSKEDLKGTQTEENLKIALQGEALAHLKYQFYKSKVGEYSKEFEALLDEIIHNEKEHGEIWFKELNGGEVPSDYMNMIDAMTGELYECHELYPHFSNVAREEGFDEIADLFKLIGDVEGRHADEFKMLKKHFNNELFAFKSGSVDGVWKCLNCGHIVKGEDAPVECPVCKHPRKYFVEFKE